MALSDPTSSSLGSDSSLHHRNIVEARRAFDVADEQIARQLSEAAHSLRSSDPGAASGAVWSEGGHNEELTHHATRLMLGGATEGVALSLAALSAAVGAGWRTEYAVAHSLSLLLCWSAFAGARQWLEELTYRSHYKRERQREQWELDNFPEGEVAEMVELYTRKGLPEATARTVVEAMAKTPDFFVDVMMAEELQMAPPNAMHAAALGARVSVAALVAGAALPLCAAIVGRIPVVGGLVVDEHDPSFGLVAIAAAGLAYLGVLRASISHQGKRRLAAQTAALALPAALLGRVCGWQLRGFGG